MKKSYKVEMATVSGWDDAEWMDIADDGTETPTRYPTKKAAWIDIRQLVKDTKEAFKDGFMDSAYHLCDYRVVQDEPTVEPT